MDPFQHRCGADFSMASEWPSFFDRYPQSEIFCFDDPYVSLRAESDQQVHPFVVPGNVYPHYSVAKTAS